MTNEILFCFWFFASGLQNPVYLLHSGHISVETCPGSRAPWCPVAGGCHSGQPGSGYSDDRFQDCSQVLTQHVAVEMS